MTSVHLHSQQFVPHLFLDLSEIDNTGEDVGQELWTQKESQVVKSERQMREKGGGVELTQAQGGVGRVQKGWVGGNGGR